MRSDYCSVRVFVEIGDVEWAVNATANMKSRTVEFGTATAGDAVVVDFDELDLSKVERESLEEVAWCEAVDVYEHPSVARADYEYDRSRELA